MLDLKDLHVAYGAAPALWGVNLTVAKAELLCVVGPNAAGKTTLINAIAGMHRATSGSIVMAGENLTQVPAHRFCASGIAVVPEGRRLFTGMTVLENLEMGSYLPPAKAKRAQTLERVMEIFPAIRAKLSSPAGNLSGGQQQMVAIARALMAQPKLLLLDEPSLGLSPLIVKEMFTAIQAINAAGTTVLLVEQNVAMAMSIAHRAYVLEQGRVVAHGRPADLLNRPEIRRAYLGLEASSASPPVALGSTDTL
jgi:branched-chain amino acid transport system ATP-binding protein